MSTESPIAPPELPEWIPGPLYRISLEKIEAIVGSGTFGPHDRFHLINGFLVAKMTQNDPHCAADDLCGVALWSVIPAGWCVRASKPVRLRSQVSKPEPDRCVVGGTIGDYSQRSPEAGDVAQVVEVADSSLAEDRKLARIYGGAGIPTYWIVNLIDRQVEVYYAALRRWLPRAPGFRGRRAGPGHP
jgi:Uma2 family endonuclease